MEGFSHSKTPTARTMNKTSTRKNCRKSVKITSLNASAQVLLVSAFGLRNCLRDRPTTEKSVTLTMSIHNEWATSHHLSDRSLAPITERKTEEKAKQLAEVDSPRSCSSMMIMMIELANVDKYPFYIKAKTVHFFPLFHSFNLLIIFGLVPEIPFVYTGDSYFSFSVSEYAFLLQ